MINLSNSINQCNIITIALIIPINAHEKYLVLAFNKIYKVIMKKCNYTYKRTNVISK